MSRIPRLTRAFLLARARAQRPPLGARRGVLRLRPRAVEVEVYEPSTTCTSLSPTSRIPLTLTRTPRRTHTHVPHTHTPRRTPLLAARLHICTNPAHHELTPHTLTNRELARACTGESRPEVGVSGETGRAVSGDTGRAAAVVVVAVVGDKVLVVGDIGRTDTGERGRTARRGECGWRRIGDGGEVDSGESDGGDEDEDEGLPIGFALALAPGGGDAGGVGSASEAGGRTSAGSSGSS
jgi:hypothetical protein